MYPTDISFNLYNAGLKDFPGPNLCLWWVKERDTFQLVGSDYKPDGDVMQYKGTKDERVIGRWKQGTFSFENHKGETSNMKQEKYVLTITAENVVSTNDEFTMDYLDAGDNYRPIDVISDGLPNRVIEAEGNVVDETR